MPDPPPVLRLLLVDDHFVVRSGVAASIGLEHDLSVVGEAADATEARTLYQNTQPDVVVMDLQLGGSSGVDLTATLCQEHPGARILIFSSFARDEDIYRSIRAGALGYLQKSAPRDEFLQAIRAVARGHRWLPADIGQRLADRLGRPEPSPRELEVLALIARGRSNKEIATDLSLSAETVKRHVSNIIEKLGVQDRTQAVTEALKRGLIDV